MKEVYLQFGGTGRNGEVGGSQVPFALGEAALREVIVEGNPGGAFARIADVDFEFVLAELGISLRVFLAAEGQAQVRSIAEGDVLHLEVGVGTEEDIVGTGSGIDGIVSVGGAVRTDGDTGEFVSDIPRAASGGVLPVLELVTIGPAAAGTIGLGSRFLVEIVGVDGAFDRGRAHRVGAAVTAALLLRRNSERVHFPGTGLGSRGLVDEGEADGLALIGGNVDIAGIDEGPAGRIGGNGQLCPLFLTVRLGCGIGNPERSLILDIAEILTGMGEGNIVGLRIGQFDGGRHQPALGSVVGSACIGGRLHAILGVI